MSFNCETRREIDLRPFPVRLRETERVDEQNYANEMNVQYCAISDSLRSPFDDADRGALARASARAKRPFSFISNLRQLKSNIQFILIFALDGLDVSGRPILGPVRSRMASARRRRRLIFDSLMRRKASKSQQVIYCHQPPAGRAVLANAFPLLFAAARRSRTKAKSRALALCRDGKKCHFQV